MNARDDLAAAIRELAAAALELAAAVRGGRNDSSKETAAPDRWSETDIAFAQRAVRPMSDIAPEERNILERMRERMRKTTPPGPKKT